MAGQACRTSLDPLLALVRANGFHGYALDVRDHADNHSAAVADIAKQLGLPEFDGAALRRELLPLDDVVWIARIVWATQ